MHERRFRGAGRAVTLALALLAAPWAVAASPVPAVARLLQRGVLLQQSCHPRQALKVLLAAHRKAPDDPDVDLALAELYNELKMRPQSLEYYQRALARDPGNQAAVVGLADELAWMQRSSQATAIANRVLQKPDVPPDQLAKAHIVLLGAQGLEAYHQGIVALIQYAFGVLPSLEETERIAPHSPDVHYALGKYYLLAPGFMGGDIHKALRELDVADELTPWDFTVRAWQLSAEQHAGQDVSQALAAYRTDFGDLPAAREELKKALALQIRP